MPEGGLVNLDRDGVRALHEQARWKGKAVDGGVRAGVGVVVNIGECEIGVGNDGLIPGQVDAAKFLAVDVNDRGVIPEEGDGAVVAGWLVGENKTFPKVV